MFLKDRTLNFLSLIHGLPVQGRIMKNTMARTMLFILLGLLIEPLPVFAKNCITWDPKNIEQTIGLGDSVTITVYFSSPK